MSNCPFKHVKRLPGAEPIIKVRVGYTIKTEEDFSPEQVRFMKRYMAMPNKRKFIHNRFVARLGRLVNMKCKAPIATAYHVRTRNFDGVKPAYS